MRGFTKTIDTYSVKELYTMYYTTHKLRYVRTSSRSLLESQLLNKGNDCTIIECRDRKAITSIQATSLFPKHVTCQLSISNRPLVFYCFISIISPFFQKPRKGISPPFHWWLLHVSSYRKNNYNKRERDRANVILAS